MSTNMAQINKTLEDLATKSLASLGNNPRIFHRPSMVFGMDVYTSSAIDWEQRNSGDAELLERVRLSEENETKLDKLIRETPDFYLHGVDSLFQMKFRARMWYERNIFTTTNSLNSWWRNRIIAQFHHLTQMQEDADYAAIQAMNGAEIRSYAVTMANDNFTRKEMKKRIARWTDMVARNTGVDDLSQEIKFAGKFNVKYQA